MVNFILFALVSAYFLYISWGALRVPGSHGFYRFFAWELMAALLVRNKDVWFKDPFSAHQLISWGLFIISILQVLSGVKALTGRGKPAKHREGEAHLLGFEKTTVLVDTGVYQYIRHPMYASLLFLNWGICFKVPDWSGVILACAATFFLLSAARADEHECIRFFGPAYEAYMKKTRRFVPFLF